MRTTLASLSKLCAAAATLVALVIVAPSLGAALRLEVASFKYVALGDSFSAGEGVDPYFRDGPDRRTGLQGVIDNRCHRSSRAYSTWVKRDGDSKTLYALASGGGKPGSFGGKYKYGSDKNVRSAGGVEWASWACAGAITKNVLPKSLGGVPQAAKGQTYDRRTQLDSADLAGADLVTITIGGNDVGFVEALEFCAVRNCNTPAFKQGRTQIIDDTKPLLEKVYKAVAERASDAQILVLGYPQLFPKTAAEQSCGGLSLFLGEQDMLRDLGTHLNDKIEAAVKNVASSGVKIRFVPVAERFAGHEVCGSKGRWLNGVSVTANAKRNFGDDQSFHPTLDGQQDGYAAAVNAALKTKTNTNVSGPNGSYDWPGMKKCGSFAAGYRIYVYANDQVSCAQATLIMKAWWLGAPGTVVRHNGGSGASGWVTLTRYPGWECGSGSGGGGCKRGDASIGYQN